MITLIMIYTLLSDGPLLFLSVLSTKYALVYRVHTPMKKNLLYFWKRDGGCLRKAPELIIQKPLNSKVLCSKDEAKIID